MNKWCVIILKTIFLFLHCLFATDCKFLCQMHNEAKTNKQTKKNLKHQNLEQRSLLYALQGEGVVHAPKTLSSPKGFTKAFLKARWERGVVSCCKLLGLGILCCCSCPQRSGQDVPINLQQDKCYSLFCNFLSRYELTLKGQSPENKLSCIFQAVATFFYKRCRASVTKHRQWSTPVKAKGMDLTWTQICSSLLHGYVALWESLTFPRFSKSERKKWNIWTIGYLKKFPVIIFFLSSIYLLKSYQI